MIKYPLAWSFICSIRNINTLKLLRKPNIQEQYNRHKIFIKNNEIDINQNIIAKYLKNSQVSLHKNDYPYDVEKCIGHYVLWSKYHLTNKEINRFLYNATKQKKYIDYHFFQNTNNLQSIPSIVHYQVFFKMFIVNF